MADHDQVPPLRLLLVEDSESDAKLVLHALKSLDRPIECQRVQTAETMEAALQSGHWDFVISDWSMPSFSARAALSVVKELELDIPFIIVSGAVGEEHAVAAMRAGARDYLLKERLGRLVPVVERELKEHRLRTAYRITEAARRDADYRMRLISESGLIGIVVSNVNGVFVEANDAFLKLVGYTREDLDAGLLTRTSLTPVDWKATDDAAIDRLRFQNAREMREKEYLCKDGTRVQVLVGGAMLDDTRGLGVVIDISQQKQAEEALRLSQDRYRRIVETANQGVWMVDAKYITTFVNGRMASMLGYTPDEMIGTSALAYTPPDQLEVANREAARSTQAASQVEGKLLKKNGATIWVLLETMPAFSDTGQLEGSFAMVMDITERKLAEEALRVTEGRLRSLWDSGLILITIADSQVGIRDINEAGAKMLGYSRAELLSSGRRWGELTPPDWHRADAEALAELRARGSCTYEKELLRKEGSRVAILTGVTLLEDGAVLAIAIDVTERKRAETNLLERVRIAALTAEMGVALAHDDALPEILTRCADAMVTHLEGALARIWLFNKEKKLELQASAGTLHHHDGRAIGGTAKYRVDLIADQRRLLFSNDLLDDPCLLDRPWAEREGLVSFAGHPLLVSGHVIGVVTVYARHPLSETVLKTMGPLADALAVGVQRKRVEEAGQSLETQLRHAQKMEAVGRLAGGVAHDFNNLLSVILSYADLILGDLTDADPMRDDIEEMRKAAVRAADLTRQLLMFSRQQVVEPKVVDLNEALFGLDKMLRRMLGEDVELATSLGPLLGRVRVDPGSLNQIIMNLVVNARDAMPIGGKLTMETANVSLDEAYVQSHHGAKPGSYVMLSVTDNGSGMERATLARIFEPFFTTKEKGKGTGLGLSTVFGIVQQSGGNVWVYSEPGAGTTFKIYLPRVDAEADDLVPKTGLASARGSETILLVEDEEQVRGVASDILRRHGYRIIVARNGGEALLSCEQHPGDIDLLLTDVVMPQMSGPELARRLGKLRPEMKVLLMSGYTDDAAVRHGMVDGELAYLQKPITVESLTRKVREVLDAKLMAFPAGR